MTNPDHTVLQTRNKTRMHIIGKYAEPISGVRAYRASPEEVCLQIRVEKRYANIFLTFEEARELARRILASAEE